MCDMIVEALSIFLQVQF